jgi:YHS domain-containing protein
MTFLARIVRFLFWLLVVSWGAWLLRRLFGSLLQNAGVAQQRANGSVEPQPPNLSRRLVRDPVCGMHVDETLSIPMRDGEELLHFCSIACRDAYVVSSKKFLWFAQAMDRRSHLGPVKKRKQGIRTSA